MSLTVYLTPDICPCCKKEQEPVFSRNITHNLNEMADKAGIYYHLWRPEEIEIKKACQLVEPLKIGLQTLRDDPNYFRQFDAKNGWGVYENLVQFVDDYLNACKENPDANVYASR